jgi:hypothetical protein
VCVHCQEGSCQNERSHEVWQFKTTCISQFDLDFHLWLAASLLELAIKQRQEKERQQFAGEPSLQFEFNFYDI